MVDTLFDTEPAEPIVLERYAVAFNSLDMEPDWQIDEDTICETQEAVNQIMAEWADRGSWKLVKLKIEATEIVE